MISSRKGRVALLATVSCCAAGFGDGRAVVARTCSEVRQSILEAKAGVGPTDLTIQLDDGETLDCLEEVSARTSRERS